MKKTFLLLLIFVLLLTACQKNEVKNDTEVTEKTENEVSEETLVYKVGLPGGVTSLSMVSMMKENPTIVENTSLMYENLNSPDLLASKLIGGELDIAVVPTNLAAKLYNKGLDYKLVGSSVWGVLYIASSEEINGVEDLENKEIAVFGKGLSPDIILNYILNEKGISDKVSLSYFNGGQEVASGLIAGKFTTGLIPEPALSIVMKKNPQVKYVIDVQELWKDISGKESYPQASLIVKGDLIKNNPEFVNAFIKAYSDNINWINENTDSAIEYSNELEIIKGIGSEGIKRSNLKFVSTDEAKDDIEAYLNILMKFDSEAVGGQLPDESFYY